MSQTIEDPIPMTVEDKIAFVISHDGVRGLDAGQILERFTCEVLVDILSTACITDARAWNTIDVKLRWLEGRASERELQGAAHDAAEASKDAARVTLRARASGDTRATFHAERAGFAVAAACHAAEPGDTQYCTVAIINLGLLASRPETLGANSRRICEDATSATWRKWSARIDAAARWHHAQLSSSGSGSGSV